MDDKPVELLPCPFCGDDAGIRTTRDLTEFWYACRGCDAETGTAETDLLAAKRWNTRKPDIKAAVEAEREACAATCEELGQSYLPAYFQMAADMIRARGDKV